MDIWIFLWWAMPTLLLPAVAYPLMGDPHRHQTSAVAGSGKFQLEHLKGKREGPPEQKRQPFRVQSGPLGGHLPQTLVVSNHFQQLVVRFFGKRSLFQQGRQIGDITIVAPLLVLLDEFPDPRSLGKQVTPLQAAAPVQRFNALGIPALQGAGR
jgi:hypothetical protein